MICKLKKMTYNRLHIDVRQKGLRWQVTERYRLRIVSTTSHVDRMDTRERDSRDTWCECGIIEGYLLRRRLARIKIPDASQRKSNIEFIWDLALS